MSWTIMRKTTTKIEATSSAASIANAENWLKAEQAAQTRCLEEIALKLGSGWKAEGLELQASLTKRPTDE